MGKFCHNLDKEEKSYDTYSSIRYIYIYTIYIHIYILEVLRDVQYECFRYMECFGFFVNILWRYVLVCKRRMCWKFLLPVYQINKTQSQTSFSAKFMSQFSPIWTYSSNEEYVSDVKRQKPRNCKTAAFTKSKKATFCCICEKALQSVP